MSRIHVRPLSMTDLDSILDVQLEAYGPTYIESREAFRSKIELAPFTSWGAFTDDRMVGYMVALPVNGGFVMPLDSPPEGVVAPDDAEVIYIHDLAVSNEASNRGVGSLLFRQVFSRAMESGATGIELVAVQDALTFWRKRGFTTSDGAFGHGYGAEAVKCTLPLSSGSGPIVVRAVRSSDVPELLSFAASVDAFAMSEEIPFYEPREVDEFIDDPDWALGVARKDGHIVGFISVHRMSWHWSVLENFYVTRPERGKGVAAHLYEWLELVTRAWDSRYLSCIVDVDDVPTMEWFNRRNWTTHKSYRWLDHHLTGGDKDSNRPD